MNNDFSVNSITSRIDEILLNFETLIPAGKGMSELLWMILIACIAAFLSGIIFRVLLGRKSFPNQVISCSLGVLFLYVCTVVVYSFNPFQLARYLSPLPFALFRDDILIMMPFTDSDFSVISIEVLSLIILCFIIHLVDNLVPKSKNVFFWFITKLLSVALAVFLSLSAAYILKNYTSGMLAQYAPVIIIGVLCAAVLIGLFNPLLCIIFSVVNPIFGILYTFFFSNIIGKQLVKSVVTTLIISLLIYAMEYYGYSVIKITQTSILSASPIILFLLCFWYLFDTRLCSSSKH